MTLLQQFGMFIMGLRDSISLQWVTEILLYLDPQTKRVHPKSKQLLKCIKSSLIKIFFYIIMVPLIVSYISYPSIFLIVKIFYLILTYGYLFFYNTDIMISTRKVIVWKEKKMPNTNFQLDKLERIQLLTKLTGKVKSFVFLVFYYLPIYLIQIAVLINIPYFGIIMLIVSESFFNGAFYFLQNWPYDKFNVGYLEKNFSYMLGYGFFISFVCNFLLSGVFATAAYLVISLWMLINTIIYSPPVVQFKSISDILNIFKQTKKRKTYKNDYNQHRQKIRQDKQYRKEIVSKIRLLYPPLKITQFLNKFMQMFLKSKTIDNKLQQEEQTNKNQQMHEIRQETQTQQMSPEKKKL